MISNYGNPSENRNLGRVSQREQRVDIRRASSDGSSIKFTLPFIKVCNRFIRKKSSCTLIAHANTQQSCLVNKSTHNRSDPNFRYISEA
jgi:hypothetical protein